VSSTSRFTHPVLYPMSFLALLVPAPLLAQGGSNGSVVVVAGDVSGAVIPGAVLKLRELETNDTFTAKTDDRGTYTFVHVPIGTYELTIAAQGYATQDFKRVIVEASQASTVNAKLPPGQVNETVSVNADVTPVLEASSNEIGLVVDMKQIEQLPLEGRDLTTFAYLSAGYNGTFNGLPSNDQGNNIDGTIGSSSRMKFVGNVEPAVQPRIEGIAEMTVQTDQLNLNSGFGQSSTQLNFVSRRGTNHFHGRAYEDFRNSGLNANSWINDVSGVRKNKLILNDFGVSVGGRILRDKLFFFGSFATSQQPGSFTSTNNFFTAAAQAGDFTYSGGTVNVLQLARQYNATLPSTVNSEISSAFSAVNSAVGTAGVTPTANPNFNQIAFINNSPTTQYFPSGRLDYNVSNSVKTYLSVMATTLTQPNVTAPLFPGSGFTNQTAGNKNLNIVASYGLDITLSPNLINQFKAGYLYDKTQYGYNAAPLYATQPTVLYNFPGANANISGQVYPTPITTFYPILNASDSITWQHAGHTVQAGYSFYREQDHYYNPPAGYPTFNLGLATGDPAIQAFTPSTMPGSTQAEQLQAQQLYAILTGRISGLNGQYAFDRNTQQYYHGISEYPLDEVSMASGLFAEDSWKAMPTLTLNYGLRWDFTGAQHDITGAYTSASPSAIYGPSGLNNLFHPGSLLGDPNPALTRNQYPYAAWKIAPQPAVGFVWSPKVDTGGVLGKLLGNSATVFRGGYALRNFTEPYQLFADNATDYFSFYYQNFYLTPNNTGAPGTFAPGSLSLGQTLPAFGLSPAQFQTVAPEAQFTFQGSTGVVGMDPHIKQPYSESWNFGIQRSLGQSRALEVRYSGNRTVHQWISINPNEVNVFENGFVDEFKRAQANLAASGGTSFSSSYGNRTPILDAAFGGASASDYTNSQYIRYLQTGQVGALAAVLTNVAGAAPYFCNLVGAAFTPCATNAGYTGAGAGYPINFFQANPYAAGTDPYGAVGATSYMVAAGYSNYNALQVDMRQSAWHGVQFDVNYTLSHSLGVQGNNQYTGGFNAFTLRNLARSYGPNLFDLRHVMHANGTFDLPFGRGRTLFNQNKMADAVIGHWNVGTIITWQTGAPIQLIGGNSTFNDYADGGLTLNGVTASQVAHSVGVHRIPGQTSAYLIDPKFVSPSGGANSAYISPNTTPGTIGDVIYIHGPHAYFQDLSVTKGIPLGHELDFRIQGEFLNVWNHPVFGNGTAPGYATTGGSFDAYVQDNGFGQGTVTNESQGFGRIIELRANIEF
jgi:hypothetical protein